MKGDDPSLTRRELMASGSVGVAASMLASHLAKGGTAAEPTEHRIDAHAHIWTRDVERFPLKQGTSVDDLDPASFTAEELLAVAAAVGVRRAVLIAHHTYYGVDNRYMLDAAKRFPGVFKVVGLLDDRQPHADQAMRRLHREQVTGFRITPWFSGSDDWLDNPGMRSMWRCAAATGQAICCLIDPHHLPQVARMCGEFPRTPVVVDHFARIGADGNIRPADVNQLCQLARFPQTHVKVSAFYALGQKQPPYDDLIPLIRRVLDAFGPERLMWASDAPYQLVGEHTYRASLDLVSKRIEFLSPGDREWMLRRTAERVYFADAGQAVEQPPNRR